MVAHRSARWLPLMMLVCGVMVCTASEPARAQPYGPYWGGPYRGYAPRFYGRPFARYYGYGYPIGPEFGFGSGPYGWYAGPPYAGWWYGGRGPDARLNRSNQ